MVYPKRRISTGVSRRSLNIEDSRRHIVGLSLGDDDIESVDKSVDRNVDNSMTAEYHEDKEPEEPPQQSRAINWIAALVVVVLLGAAAVLGWLVHSLVSSNQEEEFKNAVSFLVASLHSTQLALQLTCESIFTN